MPVAPPDDEALHEARLDHGPAERAGGGDRAHEDRLEQLVEVPLVDEEGVHVREAVAQLEREAAAAHVGEVGRGDAGQRDQAAAAQAVHSAPSLGAGSCRSSRRRSARGTSRSRRPRPAPGPAPASSASTASGAMAARIGHSRSAMWCSSAGEADVGVLGLAGRRVGRARGARGGPARARAPPRPGRPRRRGRPSGTRRRRSARRRRSRRSRGATNQPPRAIVKARISSFEKKPEVNGKAASASAPISERGERERHRLAEAAHPVHVLDAAHRR